MVTRWWEKRSNTQRFDLYTRGSLYLMVAAEPVLAVLIVLSAPSGSALGAAAMVLAAAAHGAVGLVVVRGGLEWFLGRRPWPRRPTVALVALTPLAPVAAALTFGRTPPDPVEPGTGAVAGVTLVMSVAFLVAALSPRLRARQLCRLAPVAAAGVAGVAMLAGWPARNAWALFLSGLLAFVAGWSGFRASVWTLGIVWELERSRRVQAQLAVAEERLRFSRDLHDILGRNLSVMAVKSELAAALAQRGREEAGTEMIAVRDIAQESLREVREVVRGYREVDLSTELAGARSVLRSAGVATRVVGDGDDLPPDVQSVLGWVAREGTTNVLRHSQADDCMIVIKHTAAEVTLTMENDGVSGDVQPGDGSGLAGLRERLRELGGDLSSGPAGSGRFRLTARMPLTSAATGAGDTGTGGTGTSAPTTNEVAT